MILSVSYNHKTGQVSGYTLEECDPLGSHPYRTGEATWDGSKWVSLSSWFEILILDLPEATEDYQVKVQTKRGEIIVQASKIYSKLIKRQYSLFQNKERTVTWPSVLYYLKFSESTYLYLLNPLQNKTLLNQYRILGIHYSF